MEYGRFMDIMSVLANAPTGASSGFVTKELNKRGRGVTKQQTQRALEALVNERAVCFTYHKYRHNIEMKFFFLTEKAVHTLAGICSDYIDNSKQLPLPFGNEGAEEND